MWILILYHIIHKTSRTNEALTILEENLGDYIIDTVVHNEIIYVSTTHYLEHKHGVKETYSARKLDKETWYPKEVIGTARELIKRPNNWASTEHMHRRGAL